MDIQEYVENLLVQEGFSVDKKHIVAKKILDRLAIERTNQIQELASTIATPKFTESLRKELAQHTNNLIGGEITDRTTIVPQNVRFFRNNGNHAIIIAETTPCVRTVGVNYHFHHKVIEGEIVDKIGIISRYGSGYSRGSVPVNFRLAFPYMEYIIDVATSNKDLVSLAQLRVGVRNSPLTKLGDEICWIPLPNISQDYAVCLGEYKPWWYTTTNALPIKQIVDDVIAAFWQIQFNYMLVENPLPMPTDSRIQGYRAWEKASAENPLFPLEIDWQSTQKITELIPSSDMGSESIISYKLAEFSQKISQEAQTRLSIQTAAVAVREAELAKKKAAEQELARKAAEELVRKLEQAAAKKAAEEVRSRYIGEWQPTQEEAASRAEYEYMREQEEEEYHQRQEAIRRRQWDELDDYENSGRW